MKDDLSAALKAEIENALGGDNKGELSNERADAWDYFLGEPIGTEQEGRSNVLSSDLADVIDWVMPEVVRAFGAGEAGVELAATNKDDENQAENETKAVSHVFFRQNKGLLILHNWFQEVFLQKNGYVKPYWDDEPEYENIELEGLQEMDLETLKMQGYEITSDEVIEVDEGFGPMILHNVEARKEVSNGKIVVDQVPSDEILVNPDHRDVSLKTARIAAHQRQVTQSELIGMGYPLKQVDSLPSHDDIDDAEDEARYNLTDERDYDEPIDRSQRKITFTEGYWLVDADDDGVAERYFFHYAGNEILHMEADSKGLIVSASAMPLANKHLGRSFFEKVKQIMEIKTFFLRQMVDNIANINNKRYVAVEGKVNFRDLLNNKPAGVIRAKAPGMLEPLITQPIGPDVYQFMEYLDRARTERTGVGPEIVAELGQLANSTAWGVERLMAKKEELVGLIIAMLRATGVNELFERIHELMRENYEQTIEIPVDGDWLQQDPRQWPKRTAVPPITWSGLGDKLEKQRTLGRLLEIQEKLAMSPASWMIEERHIYEAVSDMLRASGLSNIRQYMFDPQSKEGQQAKAMFMQQQQMMSQQEDPLSKAEKVKGEYQARITQMKEQSNQQIEAYKQQMQQQKEMHEAQMKEYEAQQAQYKIDADIAARQRELDIKEADLNRRAGVDQHNMAIDQEKLAMEQDETVESIEVARINAEAEIRKAEIEASKQPVENDGKPQEIHIHNTGGKKKIKVIRTVNGIEGTTETEDDIDV